MQGENNDEDVQATIKAESPLIFYTLENNKQDREQKLVLPVDIDAEIRALNQSLSFALGQHLSIQKLLDRIKDHIDTGVKIFTYIKEALREGPEKRNLASCLKYIELRKQAVFAEDLNKIERNEVKVVVTGHLFGIKELFDSCKNIIFNLKKCQEFLIKLDEYFKKIQIVMIETHFYILSIGNDIINQMKMAFLITQPKEKEEASCSCVLS